MTEPLPHDDPPCTEEVELITDYLEGALPDAQAGRLERHLAACDGCTAYLEQMRALAGGLGGLRDDALPAGLRAAILAAFHDARP